MLHSKLNPTKIYEELLSETLAQIPVYSPEWTNYNPSDPGITVLENFTAYQLIQQQSIDEVTPEIRRKLLKLVGFEPRENRPSRIPLRMPQEGEGIILPAHKKLTVAGMIFEIGKPVRLRSAALRSVYRFNGAMLQDVTPMLDPQLPMSVPPFGAQPTPETGLCLAFYSLPEPGRALTLYVQIDDQWQRNPWTEGAIPAFARLRWELWTAAGWIQMEALDRTGYFLKSGKITLIMPETAPEVGAEGLENYVIRCILEESSYDTPPRIHAIFDNVFEVRQRNTLAASFSKGGNRITVRSEMVNDELVQVFVREEGESLYRLYAPAPSGEARGRFYRVKSRRNGRLALEFDPESFGFGPGDGPDAVRVICYTEESVNRRVIGTVYGYDDQILELEGMENVVPDGFRVLAETRNDIGEPVYRFVSPGETGEDDLGYRLLSQEGRLSVYNPGLTQECILYLCDCAVTAGAAGNLRAGNRLVPAASPRSGETQLSFLSLDCEEPGTSSESVEELTERFAQALHETQSAVTAEDYENLVRATPGLCIEAVKAIVSSAENLVQIAVKPRSAQPFPRLSELYLREIRRYLRDKRMLTTRIQFVQPRYIAIDLCAKIQIRRASQLREETIRAIMEDAFRDARGTACLGQSISLQRVYDAVQTMPDVEYLYELTPRIREAGVRCDGLQILLPANCIGYLGKIQLQLAW